MSDRASMLHDDEAAWLENRLERERAQTRLFILLAAGLVPAWIPFDYLLEPAVADTILVLRLADVAVGLACLALLGASRTLRAVRTLAVLKTVATGSAIALMLPLVEQHFWPYMFGFSLVFWGSAVVFSMPWAVLALAWGSVISVAAVAVALQPVQRSFPEIVGGGFFLVTTTIICVAQAALRGRLERRASRFAARLMEASRKAMEAESQKTQFFANVSHELRTPLALILGPTERVLAAKDLTEAQREDLELVVRNARLLLRQVNDLLDVTRLDLGELEIHYVRMDLARLVRRVASQFAGLARERRIDYSLDLPPALGAEVDPRQLQSVLLNLLSNAFKVTPQGGRIRCALSARDAQRAVLEVADSGPGIALEHRSLVFERFRQIEGGPARRLGGTGLGLAIARDFVQLHGGTIEVGDAPEGGAAFRVELPLRAPAPAQVGRLGEGEEGLDEALVQQILAGMKYGEVKADDQAGEAPLVLVVEDNPELNRFVRESLSPSFRTASALNGREGLDKVLTLRPDLVIADVMMPEMSGDELVEAVRARPELDDIPILVLSAREDDALRVRILREGAQDYVTKPFSADELAARVANLVAVRRARSVLQADLESKEYSIERLAREVIAQRRRLEVALESMRAARNLAERASEMKTRFLRIVSHELRSPLTTLLLSLERLKLAPEPLPDAERAVLQRMGRSALRLRDMVESLLEYARIEGGRLVLKIETVDVVSLAREVLEDVRPQAEAKGLVLELESPDEPLPPLLSDPRLVRIILTNLLDNALKFTAAGSVTLRVGWQLGAHDLAVRDTGPGIDPAQRGHIFKPFEQLEPVDSKHRAGVGLGLALVRDVVLALGGSIGLDSSGGRGSTFTVRLPPAPAGDSPVEEPHGEHSATG